MPCERMGGMQVVFMPWNCQEITAVGRQSQIWAGMQSPKCQEGRQKGQDGDRAAQSQDVR